MCRHMLTLLLTQVVCILIRCRFSEDGSDPFMQNVDYEYNYRGFGFTASGSAGDTKNSQGDTVLIDFEADWADGSDLQPLSLNFND